MHPTDDELLALLDHEALEESSALVREHAAECAACLQRVAAIRLDDMENAALLAELDLPVPSITGRAMIERARRRSRRPSLAAAIAALAVLTVAAAAMPGSPLRARLEMLLAPHAATAIATRAPGVSPGADGVQVTPGDDFTLELARPQKSGEIWVAYTDQPLVTARAVGGVVVYRIQASKIILDNQAPADRYEITLPRQLSRARIVVANRTVFQTTSASHGRLRDTITIALTSQPIPTRNLP